MAFERIERSWWLGKPKSLEGNFRIKLAELNVCDNPIDALFGLHKSWTDYYLTTPNNEIAVLTEEKGGIKQKTEKNLITIFDKEEIASKESQEAIRAFEQRGLRKAIDIFLGRRITYGFHPQTISKETELFVNNLP